jgi:hypothetical protein
VNPAASEPHFWASGAGSTYIPPAAVIRLGTH